MRLAYLLFCAALALALGSAAPASAAVKVVATSQDLAWLTKAMGGDQVTVSYLGSSNTDPHHVEPRPSQVLELSKADMVVRVGMDLDLWMESLLRSSGNGKIQPGAKGYVDTSVGFAKLEVPAGKLDPSKGDIHVYGNPHYFSGPMVIPAVARTITDGLKRVDPGHSQLFETNYQNFVKRLQAEWKNWSAKMQSHRGAKVVTYHKVMPYFLRDFGLVEFGNVEPKPGLEPTPGHVAQLSSQMRAAGVKVILIDNWRPRRFADLLASQSGGKVIVLPYGIGSEAGVDDYFKLITTWVDRISSGL
jgi:zinc/manganese transport system substrate-binding protein